MKMCARHAPFNLCLDHHPDVDRGLKSLFQHFAVLQLVVTNRSDREQVDVVADPML